MQRVETAQAIGTPFKFKLHDPVAIAISGEIGVVIGRAEYTNSTPQYLVRYKTADGRGVESWWSEDAIWIVELSL